MTGMIQGFPASDWVRARDVAEEIISARAKRRGNQFISYTDLVAQLPLAIEPNDRRLSVMLDEISRKTHELGRGFLTVLVVHKNGDQFPGNGFFEMAELCGEDVSDREAFFIRAYNQVIEANR
ncbi:hypothetical protein BVH03_22195 [Pseudomonas sp. PA15(2017)]|uniref:hypothetical protein n=1 Tax=Pseudomonas sp. PA15(2017) TaxID=1932111 RepID=UPI00095C141F|nr:hypothetical protein [Pseudomonas sp. PA15(2017)]OLU22963.1 hypothetical protein BVH03_22195 [Pseudomonas sp. PA15(2017)]